MIRLLMNRQSVARFSSCAARFNVSADQLYLHPKEWKNLPSEQIFKLYEKRVLTLGKHYTKNQDELNALLSTAGDTGASPVNIRKVYNIESNFSSQELIAGKLEAYDPLEEPDLDANNYDEYSSKAQDLVDQHRTSREYNRIAAYELPLLAKYRQEYVPPTKSQVLKVRYTKYLGESHPAEKKVVIKAKFEEFAREAGLNEIEQHKLKLLLAKRYNPITNEIHLSLERFKYPTQNLKSLLTILDSLIKEAKTVRKGDEDYSTLPLDTRAYKRKLEFKLKRDKINAFPKEWARPQDAPVKKNDIVGKILNELTHKAQTYK